MKTRLSCLLFTPLVFVFASLGSPAKAEEPNSTALKALQQMTEAQPDNAEHFYKLSKEYGALNKPLSALGNIKKAVKLEPENTTYLRAQAQLANWNGDSQLALETLEKLQTLDPNNSEDELLLAKSYSWAGELDEAESLYENFLEKHPNHEEAWIESIKVQSWVGDYDEALDLLESYKIKFGENDSYRQQKARVLAWAGKPSASLEILEEILKKDPENFDALYTKAVALNAKNEMDESLRLIAALEQKHPGSQDLESLKRGVRLPIRSRITLGLSHYRDTDDLTISSLFLRGRHYVTPRTFLEAEGWGDYLTARSGSGLDKTNGDGTAFHSKGTIGLGHRLNSWFAAKFYLGGSRSEGESQIPTYGAQANFRVSDSFNFSLSRAHGFAVISPRTLSLGIEQSRNILNAQWRPGINWTVDFQAGLDQFTDDNHSYYGVVAPRRVALRSEHFNIDLGVRASWMKFDTQTGNGYYSPSLYQSYMGVGYFYWKISDNDGLRLITALGVLKDNSMDDYKFGLDGTLQGIFGIYRNWLFEPSISVSHNLRQTSGAYRAYVGQLLITYRF